MDTRDRIECERRFPALDETWTHWWIEGDGQLIAVLKGSMLKNAVDIVVEYFDSFVSFKVYRAKVDFDGQIIPNIKQRWEVAHNWDLARRKREIDEAGNPNKCLHEARS